MVAELVRQPTPLLFFEPDPVPYDRPRQWHGWIGGSRYDLGGPHALARRYYQDDLHGARVQRIIWLYCVEGVRRKDLARQFEMSARQIQAYVSGEAWRSYGQPLLRMLGRYGFNGRRPASLRRGNDREEGLRRLLRDVVLVYRTRPASTDADRILHLARLLVYGIGE